MIIMMIMMLIIIIMNMMMIIIIIIIVIISGREEMWPGVSQLPHFAAQFPQWEDPLSIYLSIYRSI